MPDLFIRLTPYEMAQCSQAAKFRSQSSRFFGTGNSKGDENRDGYDLDFLGIRAECAVAKAYGLEFSFLSLGLDDGADLFSGNVSIDVKSTFHRGGQLIFKKADAFRADISVLVTQTNEPDRMCIVGWKSKDRYLEAAKSVDLSNNGKRCLALSQEDLGQPERLWLYLINRANQ